MRLMPPSTMHHLIGKHVKLTLGHAREPEIVRAVLLEADDHRIIFETRGERRTYPLLGVRAITRVFSA